MEHATNFFLPFTLPSLGEIAAMSLYRLRTSYTSVQNDIPPELHILAYYVVFVFFVFGIYIYLWYPRNGVYISTLSNMRSFVREIGLEASVRSCTSIEERLKRTNAGLRENADALRQSVARLVGTNAELTRERNKFKKIMTNQKRELEWANTHIKSLRLRLEQKRDITRMNSKDDRKVAFSMSCHQEADPRLNEGCIDAGEVKLPLDSALSPRKGSGFRDRDRCRKTLSSNYTTGSYSRFYEEGDDHPVALPTLSSVQIDSLFCEEEDFGPGAVSNQYSAASTDSILFKHANNPPKTLRVKKFTKTNDSLFYKEEGKQKNEGPFILPTLSAVQIDSLFCDEAELVTKGTTNSSNVSATDSLFFEEEDDDEGFCISPAHSEKSLGAVRSEQDEKLKSYEIGDSLFGEEEYGILALPTPSEMEDTSILFCEQ